MTQIFVRLIERFGNHFPNVISRFYCLPVIMNLHAEFHDELCIVIINLESGATSKTDMQSIAMRYKDLSTDR